MGGVYGRRLLAIRTRHLFAPLDPVLALIGQSQLPMLLTLEPLI